MEYFKALTGADTLHVPYKGAVPAITDLMADSIDALLFAAQTAAPPVKAGKLRAPEVRQQIEDTGTIVTADLREEYAKKLKADYERNGKIIRENRIQAE